MTLTAVHDNRRRHNQAWVQLRWQVTLTQLMFVLFVQMRQSLGGDLCRWQIKHDLTFEQTNDAVKVREGHVSSCVLRASKQSMVSAIPLSARRPLETESGLNAPLLQCAS